MNPPPSSDHFNFDDNSPLRIYCSHCGRLHNVKPGTLSRASCASCHWPLERMRTVRAKGDFLNFETMNWKEKWLFFMLVVSVLYFLFQYVLQPKKWKIIYSDGSREDRGLYLVASTYTFWGHEIYPIEIAKDGEIYYRDKSNRRIKLPEPVTRY